jgi:putative transposase
MSRRARVVVLGCPHHVTQRGNKRERIFFEEGDQQVYLDLMAEQLAKHEIACWSYCLMPNHVHFILVPTKPDTLARAVGEAHRRYTLHVGQREKWRGHLFQGRFYSVAMDEGHLMAAFRYVALNPVKAKLCKRARQWPYASTAILIEGKSDKYVDASGASARIKDFGKFIVRENNVESQLWSEIRRNEFTGRPVGTKEWLERLDQELGGIVLPAKRGRKAKLEVETK